MVYLANTRLKNSSVCKTDQRVISSNRYNDVFGCINENHCISFYIKDQIDINEESVFAIQ